MYRSLRKCFEENGDNSISKHLYKTLSLRFRISVLKWFFDGLVQVRGQHWEEKEKEVEHNISTLFLQLIQVLMSRIVAQSISILSYDSCVFEFSLTERKLIHGSICLVSHALFLEGPYAFFRPYHLTLTALIRNFFQRVFPRNCARERVI